MMPVWSANQWRSAPKKRTRRRSATRTTTRNVPSPTVRNGLRGSCTSRPPDAPAAGSAPGGAVDGAGASGGCWSSGCRGAPCCPKVSATPTNGTRAESVGGRPSGNEPTRSPGAPGRAPPPQPSAGPFGTGDRLGEQGVDQVPVDLVGPGEADAPLADAEPAALVTVGIEHAGFGDVERQVPDLAGEGHLGGVGTLVGRHAVGHHFRVAHENGSAQRPELGDYGRPRGVHAAEVLVDGDGPALHHGIPFGCRRGRAVAPDDQSVVPPAGSCRQPPPGSHPWLEKRRSHCSGMTRSRRAHWYDERTRERRWSN